MELEARRSLYIQQIAASEPTLKIDSWEENREGLVNDVVIVNKQHIFRFPTDQKWGEEDLWAEANILTLLHKRVTLHLPCWTVYDGELIGMPFAGYEMIVGRPLQKFLIDGMTKTEQNALIKQLATFLQQMHTTPLEGAEIRPSLTNRTHQDWLKLYSDVQNELFPHLMPLQKEWVHHHFAPVVEDAHFMDYSSALMNGDLAPYHLLYDNDTKLLNGIIDFGTAGIGDPACDIACLLNQYGDPFVQRLIPHYPAIEEMLPRAKFWAGTLNLQWALGGLRHPNDLSWFFVHIGRA